MIFLVIHLGINLCLLRSDGGEWFNAAAHFMGTNYIVKVFEVVLFGGFILHILIGILLQIQNWLSRPVRYKVKNRSYTPFLSKYMIYTGAIVLIFLILHFMNFYFIKLGWVSNPHITEGEPDFYLIARDLFLQPLYSFLYIVLIIILNAVRKKQESMFEDEPEELEVAAPVSANVNRGELAAVVASSIAEVMGKDVTGLRIASIKRVD